jgi:predicted transcriptional regulator
LIGQATGGVGREALKVEKAVTSIASGEELATYNVPVLGRMIGDVKQKTVETSRFYENVKTLNEHQHEIEGRLKAGEDINDYLNSHPEALMYKYADQVYNKVNDMKRIRRTMKEQGMSSDDLKIYDENILMMMTVLNESIRDMRATR